ncbi:hypothetical protein Q7P37_001312 [Cladosporium fusiforme]
MRTASIDRCVLPPAHGVWAHEIPVADANDGALQRATCLVDSQRHWLSFKGVGTAVPPLCAAADFYGALGIWAAQRHPADRLWRRHCRHPADPPVSKLPDRRSTFAAPVLTVDPGSSGGNATVSEALASRYWWRTQGWQHMPIPTLTCPLSHLPAVPRCSHGRNGHAWATPGGRRWRRGLSRAKQETRHSATTSSSRLGTDLNHPLPACLPVTSDKAAPASTHQHTTLLQDDHPVASPIDVRADEANSTGSKVSLLNDSSDVAPLATKAQHQLPPLAAQYSHQHHHSHHHYHQRAHSRASSCTSTPSLSPQTPQLVRSDSSDSRVFGTPSPLTPAHTSFHDHQQNAAAHQHNHAAHSHASHGAQQQYFIVQHRYGKMDDPAMSMYPPPDASNLAMPSAYAIPAQIPTQGAPPVQQPIMQPMPQQQQPQQLYRSSNSPSSEPSRVSTVSAASNNARAAAPKKNQYPCPLSKQYNCADYFTTSGHAARHAKKHTGKKDAFCPECNKAFTRKDNMEQHRRTHQNGRGASRASGSSDDSKVKKPTKPAPKKPLKVEPALEAAVEQQLAEQQQSQSQAQMPIVQAQMQPRPQSQQQATDPAILIPPVGGPYFLNSIDPGPIHSLPMPAMNEASMRPHLQRSTYGANSLDYFPPPAQMMGDPDNLNFSYPSPGLSNGLNSLALAASEHRRLSKEKTAKSPSSEGPTPYS